MLEFKLTEPVIHVPADHKTLMLVLKLGPMEARFLHAMLEHPWVGTEEMPDLKNSKRQTAFVMRRKLDPKGVLIVNDGAGKYCLPPTSKQRWVNSRSWRGMIRAAYRRLALACSIPLARRPPSR